MRSVLALSALVFGVGLGVACGGEDEPSGAAQYAREKRQFAQVFCTCAEEETEVQSADSPCVRSYLDIGGRSECEEEVLEERWEELKAGGECLRDAYEAATDCLQQACGVEVCLGVLANESERCPTDAEEAFLAECDSPM